MRKVEETLTRRISTDPAKVMWVSLPCTTASRFWCKGVVEDDRPVQRASTSRRTRFSTVSGRPIRNEHACRGLHKAADRFAKKHQNPACLAIILGAGFRLI